MNPKYAKVSSVVISMLSSNMNMSMEGDIDMENLTSSMRAHMLSAAREQPEKLVLLRNITQPGP
ncbi:hypothetical protein CGRA01v4_15090 [Colletotrichum graminicola]|uniref:Uncharacterized protein n=1 Tax=Colletotrichum graminicola (strain M1.001 / M2 / FGSC 10212) TaxID=645133 RepID=E3R0M7_COLGM|nr:uncharacterized protein GLRG_11811 [Colletotrichum graminicola M1.001]EFQ36665.1 hypothetical protein GLRG_11811 [Colletotrichum graminicola M1.001]WDK23798.1 hypothetical protein CGRA01v4_15090 [Colletotrichum graminicola]